VCNRAPCGGGGGRLYQNLKSELPGFGFGEHIVGEGSFLNRGDLLGWGKVGVRVLDPRYPAACDGGGRKGAKN